MATIKSWFESNWKSMVSGEDDLISQWQTVWKQNRLMRGNKTTTSEIEPAKVKKLTKSMDKRLFTVTEKKDNYMKM